jgi:hypothetical protein
MVPQLATHLIFLRPREFAASVSRTESRLYPIFGKHWGVSVGLEPCYNCGVQRGPQGALEPTAATTRSLPRWTKNAISLTAGDAH